VNAGSIPRDHWTQDPATGGGRIAGEACHFIDLLRFLVGSTCPPRPGYIRQSSDTVTITITYEDGSIGTVHYFATVDTNPSQKSVSKYLPGAVSWFLTISAHLKGFGWPRLQEHEALAAGQRRRRNGSRLRRSHTRRHCITNPIR
jgi:predicted dehydrogenase